MRSSTASHPGAEKVSVAVLASPLGLAGAFTQMVVEALPEVLSGSHQSEPEAGSSVQEPALVRTSTYSVPPSAVNERLSGVTLSVCSSSCTGFTQPAARKARAAATKVRYLFIGISVVVVNGGIRTGQGPYANEVSILRGCVLRTSRKPLNYRGRSRCRRCRQVRLTCSANLLM